MRNRNLLVRVMLMVSLLIFLFKINATAQAEVVDIPDPNLEAALREALGIPSEPLTDTDLAGLIVLSAGRKRISNLTGLEYCVKLETLALDYNQISDISALAGLNTLQLLNLHHNYQIIDISALAGLNNLQELRIENNRISDISVLAGLSNLQSLWLHRNQIIDISALAGLNNLQDLGLNNNQISNISALAGLVNLERLSFSYNQISDISALTGLNNLQHLALHSNQIIDISALVGLGNLEQLYCGSNQIIDISPLAGLGKLRTLWLYVNQISDISALTGLTNLRTLIIHSNQISEISPLAGLTNLFWLGLSYNQISDISPLAGLTNLHDLTLSHNQITDISALAGLLTNPRWLHLDHNQLSNLQPLVTGPGVWDQVSVQNNPLSYGAINTDIPILQGRGMSVYFDSRVPTTLSIVSGDGQTGEPGFTLPDPFVVKVEDQNSDPYEGVPVTFTITAGGGSLSNGTTTTDADCLAETSLTLGPGFGTNTVEAVAADIASPVTFNAISIGDAPFITSTPVTTATKDVLYLYDVEAIDADIDSLTYSLTIFPERMIIDSATGLVSWIPSETQVGPHAVVVEVNNGRGGSDTQTFTVDVNAIVQVDIPDPNLRAKLESALGKNPGNPITSDELATLTNLDANHRNIILLTGLEYCVNLRSLDLSYNQISHISALAGLSNLQELTLVSNQISDMSVLAGLNNLEQLYIDSNQISDINALAGLNNLQTLSLAANLIINEISPLAGLSNLRWLELSSNQISDISPLAGLNNLETLLVNVNQINDISPLSGLNNLKWLGLDSNQVSDLQPLVDNPGLGAEDTVEVRNNPLNYETINMHIPILQGRGIHIDFDNRIPTILSIVSGDGQTVPPQSTLPAPLVVKVEDQNNNPYEGVPVTFTVTTGGGLLSNGGSIEAVTADADGLAETTLTLGPGFGTNTVEAVAADIATPVTFNAIASFTHTFETNALATIDDGGLQGEKPRDGIPDTLESCSYFHAFCSDPNHSPTREARGVIEFDITTLSDISLNFATLRLLGGNGSGGGTNNRLSGYYGDGKITLDDWLRLDTLIATLPPALPTVDIDVTSYVQGAIDSEQQYVGFVFWQAFTTNGSSFDDGAELILSADVDFDVPIPLPSPCSTDTTPPSAITNLAALSPTVNTITLTWTAPGDDGSTGTANQSDIRYSTSPITDANWDSATQATGEPSPQAAGTSESLTVTGLSSGTTYHFAIKTADEVPNWSVLSNVATGETLSTGVLTDVTALSQIDQFNIRFDRRTGQHSVMATLTNIGITDPLGQPLHLVIESITPDTVPVANADGTTEDGKPYYDYSTLVGDGKLDPGETSEAKQLAFNNPTRARFEFDVSCWAMVEGGGAPRIKPIGQAKRIHIVIPVVSALAQNFPNPFNPDTWIPYELAEANDVKISIYDIKGRLVKTIHLGYREIGQYFSKEESAYWDGRNNLGEKTGSGIYFYQIQAGDFQAVRKMVIVK